MLELFQRNTESKRIEALEEELRVAQALIAELRIELQALKTENEQLRQENQALKVELSKYKKPPKNSENSSIPPSQDPLRRRYPKRPLSDRKPGGQQGHKGHFRPLVEDPDIIESLHSPVCQYCGKTDLCNLPDYRERRQEISLPKPKAVITEYHQCRSICQHCGKDSWGQFPAHIQAQQQLSPDAQGMIAYLKIRHHQSNDKIQDLLENLSGVSLSKGAIENNYRQTAKRMEAQEEKIRATLRQSDIVGSDETRNKVNGQNAVQWVFQNDRLCLFETSFSKGYKVIESVFPEQEGEAQEGEQRRFPESWVSDRAPAQLKVPTHHQICLVHLLRECRYAIEAEQSHWCETLQQILKETTHFRREGGDEYDPLEPETFRRILDFEARLAQLFANPPPPKEEEALRLYKGLLGRQEHLLYFLRNLHVPFHNNASESALRDRKMHLKVIGSFRTLDGAKCADRIASVIESAIRQGLDILDVLSGKIRLFSATT
jgi:transposase